MVVVVFIGSIELWRGFVKRFRTGSMWGLSGLGSA